MSKSSLPGRRNFHRYDLFSSLRNFSHVLGRPTTLLDLCLVPAAHFNVYKDAERKIRPFCLRDYFRAAQSNFSTSRTHDG